MFRLVIMHNSLCGGKYEILVSKMKSLINFICPTFALCFFFKIQAVNIFQKIHRAETFLAATAKKSAY